MTTIINETKAAPEFSSIGSVCGLVGAAPARIKEAMPLCGARASFVSDGVPYFETKDVQLLMDHFASKENAGR